MFGNLFTDGDEPQMPNEADRTIFRIPERNYPKFEAQIEKLSKRSMKLIGQPIKPLVFGYEMVKVTEPYPHEYKVYEVLLNAETPKYDGWVFVARIDHSQETGNIIRMVPNIGIELDPSYRTASPACDHCRHKRLRRDTFVVRHEETGEFKQLGATCLADFLGHDASKIARLAEFLGYAVECGYANQTLDDDWDHTGLNDYRYISLETFLAHTAMAIRENGWVSGSAAYNNPHLNATKGIARDTMFPSRYDIREGNVKVPSPEDIALATEALEWAQGLSEKENLSDYEHNVLVIANATYIEGRATGLAASIVGVFHMNTEKGKQEVEKRRLEAEERRAFKEIVKNVVHMGQPGDKIKNLRCRVLRVRTTEFSTILKLITEDNKHILTWFATSFTAKVGDKIELTSGTVREHRVYEEVPETNVHRCRAKMLTAATVEA